MATERIKTLSATEAEAIKNDVVSAFIENNGDNWEQVQGSKNSSIDEGETVIGNIVSLPYESGESYAFEMEVEGEVVTYWCRTILRNLLKKCSVGDFITIKCIGRVSSKKGSPGYDYVLMREKRN